jgi:hypothetical protein
MEKKTNKTKKTFFYVFLAPPAVLNTPARAVRNAVRQF